MRHAIAAEFVGDDLSRHTTRFKKSLEETFCCFRVSSFLQIDINDFTILINSAPEEMLFATNLYEHFVQKVGIAKARVSAAKTFGKLRAEFVDPESNGFIANGNIAFSLTSLPHLGC